MLTRLEQIQEILLWCKYGEACNEHTITPEFAEEVDRFEAGCHELISMAPLFKTLETDEEVQFHFYEIAKKYFGQTPKELKVFFEYLYFLLFREKFGPRWGEFVRRTKVDLFCEMVTENLENPFRNGAEVQFKGFTAPEFVQPNAKDLVGVTVPEGCVILKNRLNKRLYYRAAA